MPFPVDSQWIAETETRLGVRFPASFVVAMSQMNGGTVEIGSDVFWLHPFLDKSDPKRIKRTTSSICRETAALRSLEYFQKELVAIAHNGSGDALVLKPTAEDPTILEHAVYWWDHETSQLELVADDFGDLPKT